MLCLRCSRGLTATTKPSSLWSVPKTVVQQSSKRTLTSLLGPSRPTVFKSSLTIRPSPASAISATAPAGTLSTISAPRAFSTTSVMGAPRDTFDPSHFVRKRRHGFLSRVRTRKGRALLKRRKAKGRSTLSH